MQKRSQSPRIKGILGNIEGDGLHPLINPFFFSQFSFTFANYSLLSLTLFLLLPYRVGTFSDTINYCEVFKELVRTCKSDILSYFSSIHFTFVSISLLVLLLLLLLSYYVGSFRAKIN